MRIPHLLVAPLTSSIVTDPLHDDAFLSEGWVVPRTSTVESSRRKGKAGVGGFLTQRICTLSEEASYFVESGGLTE